MALVSLQPDLFRNSALSGGAAAFEQAFRNWLTSQRKANRLRRDASEAIYGDMWNAFASWCLAEDPTVTLTNLTAVDIRRFLDSREGRAPGSDLSARYSWRMANLIDRVLTHLAAAGQQPKNSAASDAIAERNEIRTANFAAAPLPDYLPAEEARRLVVFLSRIRPRAQGNVAVTRWQDLRNRTAVALHLGAGVTPGEVRQLTLKSPISAGARTQGVPWKITVAQDGSRQARDTPIAPWAGHLLKYWLEVRESMSFPSDPQAPTPTDWLFPSTRKGKQWASVPHWKAVKEVLTDAGIESVDGGAFRLRHTFALRQLRKGTSAVDVARWMGIAHAEELERYQRVLMTPQIVA